jgi:HEAT repeat protein
VPLFSRMDGREKHEDAAMSRIPIPPSIAQCLASEDDEDRCKGLDSLSELGMRAEGIVPELEKFLQDPNGTVRVHAAVALGSLEAGGQAATPKLGDRLRDPREEERVRSWAATALARIGETGLSELVESLKSENAFTRRKAASNLGTMEAKAEPATQSLIDHLDDEDIDVRRCAGDALGSIGKSAISRLVGELNGPREMARVHAANAILRTEEWHDDRRSAADDPETPYHPEKLPRATRAAIETLAQALNSTDSAVRYDAVTVLSGIGRYATPAIPGLIQALKDEREETRKLAVMILSGLDVNDARISPALADALRQPGTSIRMSLQMLLAFGPRSDNFTAALRSLLNDQNEETRVWAARALTRIKQHVGGLPKTPWDAPP